MPKRIRPLIASGPFAALVLGFAAALFAGSAIAAPSAADTTLDAKLKAQWQRYAEARQLAVQTVNSTILPPAKRVVSRSQWESLLTPQDGSGLTSNDIALLRARQLARIRAARDQAIGDSLIDFRKIRKLPGAEAQAWAGKFCRAFPKGGMLHVHPGGTITPQTADELLSKSNVVLPIEQLYLELSNPFRDSHLYREELDWFWMLPPVTRFLNLSDEDRAHFVDFFALPPGRHAFGRFNAVFRFVDLLKSPAQNLRRVYEAFVSRAAAEKVDYVEFTTAVNSENIMLFEAMAKDFESRYDVIIRFNNAFNRGGEAVDEQFVAKTFFDAAAHRKSPVVTGIDLVGEEDGSPALEYGQVFYATALKRSNLHRTQHAGEQGDLRNPRDAMILGAERLGHGVALWRDPVALEYAAKNHIAIETNLTSNLRLGSVSNLASHPFLNFLRLGLPASLSTDDEGILDTDIDKECELAVLKTDVTYAELKSMSYNSISTSFADQPVKTALTAKLNGDFSAFEQRLRTAHGTSQP